MSMLFLRILRDIRAKHRDTQCRFSTKVLRRGPNECWLWLGRRNGPSPRQDGSVRPPYGTFEMRGRVLYAHRWALFGVAALTRKDKALHTCDNSLCCNPAHLYAGTTADNLRDAEQRARIGRIRGRFVKVAPHIGDVIHSSLNAGPVTLVEPWAGSLHVISANDTTGALL